MVAGLGHTHFAIRVMLDEDHPLGPDLLVFDELYESLEVLLGRLEALVASYDDIECIFHLVLTFFAEFKRNSAPYQNHPLVWSQKYLPHLECTFYY